MSDKYLLLAKQLINTEYDMYYKNNIKYQKENTFSKMPCNTKIISYDEYYNIQIVHYKLKLEKLNKGIL